MSLYLKLFPLPLCSLMCWPHCLTDSFVTHGQVGYASARYSANRCRRAQIPKNLRCSLVISQLSFPSTKFAKFFPPPANVSGNSQPHSTQESQLFLSHSDIFNSSKYIFCHLFSVFLLQVKFLQ